MNGSWGRVGLGVARAHFWGFYELNIENKFETNECKDGYYSRMVEIRILGVITCMDLRASLPHQKIQNPNNSQFYPYQSISLPNKSLKIINIQSTTSTEILIEVNPRLKGFSWYFLSNNIFFLPVHTNKEEFFKPNFNIKFFYTQHKNQTTDMRQKNGFWNEKFE